MRKWNANQIAYDGYHFSVPRTGSDGQTTSLASYHTEA